MKKVFIFLSGYLSMIGVVNAQSQQNLCTASANSITSYLALGEYGTTDGSFGVSTYESVPYSQLPEAGAIDYGYHEVQIHPGVMRNDQNLVAYWNAWIDFNQDGVFQANEKLPQFKTYNTNNNQNRFNINIPKSAKLGTAKMRIIMNLDNYSESCGTIANGSVVDTNITIVANPNISVPTGFNASEVTTNSVKLNWNHSNDGSRYYIVDADKEDGRLSDSNSGTIGRLDFVKAVVDNQSSTEIKNLTPNKTYSFRIAKSDPRTGKISDYSEVLTVKTRASREIQARVYPNPTSDFVNIQSDYTIVSAVLYRMDASRSVVNVALDNNRLDLRGQQPGLYFLVVKTAGSPYNTSTFIRKN
ncbi:hypothetical protein F3J23_20860 [Chryseobacterium sp. Tr-659]|uniref:GEVED domain-containing protein n=1 Tax=Chryseobacterium sp. Tr-659 TaxID=2608340 RepID=UPI0014213EAD|nr:GEVED domain-containing protein [Chryseobacterium sp. Tr-659]NIF07882.1 hypothetical protein [Chryseobacterium sp. Tr-659]